MLCIIWKCCCRYAQKATERCKHCHFTHLHIAYALLIKHSPFVRFDLEWPWTVIWCLQNYKCLLVDSYTISNILSIRSTLNILFLFNFVINETSKYITAFDSCCCCQWRIQDFRTGGGILLFTAGPATIIRRKKIYQQIHIYYENLTNRIQHSQTQWKNCPL